MNYQNKYQVLIWMPFALSIFLNIQVGILKYFERSENFGCWHFMLWTSMNWLFIGIVLRYCLARINRLTEIAEGIQTKQDQKNPV